MQHCESPAPTSSEAMLVQHSTGAICLKSFTEEQLERESFPCKQLAPEIFSLNTGISDANNCCHLLETDLCSLSQALSPLLLSSPTGSG